MKIIAHIVYFFTRLLKKTKAGIMADRHKKVLDQVELRRMNKTEIRNTHLKRNGYSKTRTFK